MKNTVIRLVARSMRSTRDVSASAGLLILRVGIGATMAFGHGWGKLMSYGERAANFPDPLGVGSPASLALVVFAEFFASIALALGFATRLFAIPLVINMLVIVFVIHGGDPWRKQEYGLLFLIPAVTLLFAGAGRFSVDGIVSRRT